MNRMLLTSHQLYRIWWFILCVGYAACLSESDLLPFGNGAGDTAMAHTDDTYVSVDFQTSYRFLGVTYPRTIYVNTNGQVSFRGGITAYVPKPWSTSTPPSIAIFWADIDIRIGGNGWYQRTSSTSVLNAIKQDIVRAFPSAHNFHAVTALVVTWHEVAFYNANSIGVQLRNTFQCVLTSDGTSTFVIFNYVKLQWAGDGNKSTGLGKSAQVGFSTGSATGSISLEGALTDDVKNLVHKSNVDIPGKFVFSLGDSIEAPVPQLSHILCIGSVSIKDFDSYWIHKDFTNVSKKYSVCRF